jgi:hypothetical protein
VKHVRQQFEAGSARLAGGPADGEACQLPPDVAWEPLPLLLPLPSCTEPLPEPEDEDEEEDEEEDVVELSPELSVPEVDVVVEVHAVRVATPSEAATPPTTRVERTRAVRRRPFSLGEVWFAHASTVRGTGVPHVRRGYAVAVRCRTRAGRRTSKAVRPGTLST